MQAIHGYLAGIAIALSPLAASGQQSVAGEVLWLSGQVESVDLKGISRPLERGDVIHLGDTVRTGPGSYAQILMKDDARLGVRPDSSVRVKDYQYSGRPDGSERAVYQLIRGGLRAITGAVGSRNKDRFMIHSEDVMIGIRGTDHETFTGAAGTYNRVTLGGTYLQNEQGRVDLDPGQAALAGAGAPPSLLQRTPEFMHLTKAALPAGAPFNDGVVAHGKRALPEQAALPTLPQNAGAQGWGRGGRCGGPCSGELGGGVGKGIGKGIGRGNGKGGGRP